MARLLFVIALAAALLVPPSSLATGQKSRRGSTSGFLAQGRSWRLLLRPSEDAGVSFPTQAHDELLNCPKAAARTTQCRT
jgi:hypothetical protein